MEFFLDWAGTYVKVLLLDRHETIEMAQTQVEN